MRVVHLEGGDQLELDFVLGPHRHGRSKPPNLDLHERLFDADDLLGMMEQMSDRPMTEGEGRAVRMHAAVHDDCQGQGQGVGSEREVCRERKWKAKER